MSARSTNGLLRSSPTDASRSDVEACELVSSGNEDPSFGSVEGGDPGVSYEHADTSDPFDIARTKDAPIEALRRWRRAALVLNASRRFRYTLDLKNAAEKEKRERMIRAHAQVVRAAVLFKRTGERHFVLDPTSHDDYGIRLEKLSSMSRDHNLQTLQDYGGVNGLSRLLKTNLESGTSEDENDFHWRREKFGENSYPEKKGKGFWRFAWEACKDLTLIILIIAAIASLAFGIKTEGIQDGWYDGASISVAVILVIAVTAISDYRQSLQFLDLNREKKNIQLEVVRGGRRVKLSIFDVVVGDIIPLGIGDQVPADGVFVSGHSLAIDESSMTGESSLAYKDQSMPFLLSGCKVADGIGTMLVTAVGCNTEWGLMMASVSEDTGEETPLQVRLNGVATFIGFAGLSVALVVLVVLLGRYFTGHTKDTNGRVQFLKGKTSFGHAFDGAIKIVTIAVTIVVVAVPEGLPLAVTLTLAYSMRKMMQDKALVRRLSACETMGSATTICSDKTGTLTSNEMTVVEAYVGNEKLISSTNSSQPHPTILSLVFEGISQNTAGSVFAAKDSGAIEISGSPTDKALLWWAVKLGMEFDSVRLRSTVLQVFPFNSEKKRSGVAVQADSKTNIHWKGAAELILAACSKCYDSNGCLQPIEEHIDCWMEVIRDMAERSLRCIAFAYKPYDLQNILVGGQGLDEWKFADDDLIFLGVVGIKDPCRPGVRDAVKTCQKAGVKVKMVTGDNLLTAKAIALECGIINPSEINMEHIITEGRAFRAYSVREREEIAPGIKVMARSSPNDKLLLVKALKNLEEVVAVTGDGTNDAPALHEADIGLSMGIQGTEVAKENSDIIILDDNFSSVVKVVRWGRSVYANIQKFIQFQLTVNVAALIINVVAAISSGEVPLNAVQLLWVNLIMDTLGALALATEPPADSLMLRKPVGRSEPLITNIMWRNLLVQALYQVTVLLVLNFRGKSILHLEHESTEHASLVKNTMIFNTFVLCQIFNEFNARKPEEFNVFSGVTKNKFFMSIIGITVTLQVIIVQFTRKFTSTTKLSWKLWLASIAIGIVSWPLAAIGKLIPVPTTPLSRLIAEPFRRLLRSCGS